MYRIKGPCNLRNEILGLQIYQVKGYNQVESPTPLCAASPTFEGSDAMVRRMEALEKEIERLKQQVGGAFFNRRGQGYMGRGDIQ